MKRIGLIALAWSVSLWGQQIQQKPNEPAPQASFGLQDPSVIQRLPESKADAKLSGPIPRLADGKPDLSGLWEADATPRSELDRVLPPGFFDLQVDLPSVSKYVLNLLWDLKPEDDPSRPETLAILKQRGESSSKDLPGSRCLPNSIPLTPLILPFKLVQTQQQMVMLFEHYDPPRQIYTDGRRLPKDLEPSWMGYSVGHWDGNTTFVVDTVGFNEKTWLDRLGHAHSEQLHVTERFRRVDRDHLQLDITMADPKALAKPWTTTFYYENRPDWELGEISCSGDYLDFNNFESFSFKKKDDAAK